MDAPPNHWYDAVAALLAALVGGGGIKYWYHVRKLQRADNVDGGVSKSLTFVLTELRAELARSHADCDELRARVAALEEENRAQRAEIEALRSKLHS